MINTDRIVSVQATDLLTLYGLILKMDTTNNSSLAAVQAINAEGDFAITSAATPLLCAEPAKTIDLAAAVTSATVYFVPAYDYAGFTLAGVKTTPSGSVTADGNTLYKAVLADSAVTITKCGL
jgi:hypothetical protein